MGKIYYLAALYRVAPETVTKGQSRQAVTSESSSIHSAPGCPISRLLRPRTLRPSPPSYRRGAEGPHHAPTGDQHWPRPPRTLWVLPSTSQVLHGPGAPQAVHTCPVSFGRPQALPQCQLAAGQNKKHCWALAVSTDGCWSTALQHNMAQSFTCSRQIISSYYFYSGERNQVGKCKATGQGMELGSILMHNIMTRQQQQCKTLKNFNIWLIQFMPLRTN